MKAIYIGLALMSLAACTPTLTPFTNSLYEKYNWSDDELKQIQFYLSDNVVLHRDFDKVSATDIRKGSIKIVDGRKVEEIVIPRGTPGVMIFKPGEKKFAISFEADSNERFLMFGPNPKRGGDYVLLATEWEGRNAIVSYNGNSYVAEPTAAWARLLVDLNKSRNLQVEKRTAKGRTVTN